MRLLSETDRPGMEAFLLPGIETSMFLLGNSRAAGLVDEGRRLQGTYVGAFDGEQLVAVVCHSWNGMLLLQAPVRCAELCRAAVRLTGRAVKGAIGPLEQVR